MKIPKINSPQELQREVKMWQILMDSPHDNIVKMLAIEEDEVSGKRVLIMEYCSGGSLHETLKKHKSGLPDAELLLVLEHLGNIFNLVYKVNRLSH